jgi:hypothetical protein
MTALTPSDPLTWMTLAAVNALFIISSVATKWLRVTYRPQSGTEETVYLGGDAGMIRAFPASSQP